VNVGQLKASGLVDDQGNAQKAVLFSGPNGEANVAGQKIVNVAAGTDDTDAVNVAQLKASGLVDDQGNAQKAVLFSGPNGEANVAGQKIVNVAAGTDDTDAVNVAQLKASGLVDDQGNAQKAVLFSGPNGEANVAGQKIVNVAAGTDDTDAVNVSQLKATGLIGDSGQAIAAVTYDANSNGTPNYNSVTLGGGLSGGPVTLTNVAEGKSTYDAVNFGQLSALQDYATNIDSRVMSIENGGGSGGGTNAYFNATDIAQNGSDRALANAAVPGAGAGSTAAGSGAAVAGNYGTAVGSNASAGDDNAVAIGANAAATGVNSTAIGTGSQAANTNAVALGQGSVTDRDKSVSVGSSTQQRQITNVAAGTADTDAVNVGQLNSSVAQGVQQANNYTDQRFNDVNNSINNVAKNAYAGIAAAMAMPNMTPSGPGRTIVSAGAAHYKGGSAAAAGATYRSQNGKWLVHGAVSVTSIGDAGVRAQVGYEF
jgi:autotransporter adhesin